LFRASRRHSASESGARSARSTVKESPRMPSLPNNFGLLPEEQADYARSRVAVLPVPFERTVSYGKGTASGPAAILRASQSMELYDEELRFEPAELGIATLPPFLPEAFDLAEAMDEL